MPVTPRFLKGFNLKEVRVLTYLSLLLPALCGIFTINRLAVTCIACLFLVFMSASQLFITVFCFSSIQIT